MKNACKHLALCTLTLILCLALAACGSDDSGDYTDYGDDSNVPSTIDGFVKESYDSYDYSAFEGACRDTASYRAAGGCRRQSPPEECSPGAV